MPKPGLPKKYAKMGFKKGWRAFKASKRARKRRGTTTRRKTTRRSNPKRTNNPVRKMARKSKNFNINLLDLGGGIVLADQFLGTAALNQIFKLQVPNLAGLPARLRSKSVQQELIKTGVGIAIIKTAARGFARQVGAIGPVKLKI